MTIICSVFIATSLDGFIARANGALDWLPGSDSTHSDEDYGFHDFFDSVDTLVMGRNTYELALTFEDWPYDGKRVMVLGHQFPEEPKMLLNDALGTSLPPKQLLNYLESLGSEHVYVDGGKTIQSFLREGLIDDITITRIPVLIGEGISLFGAVSHDIVLQHVGTKGYKTGLVQSRYKVI